MTVNNNALCSNCIGETYLSRIVEDGGKCRPCNYCSQSGRTFLLDEICEHVETAFKVHFTRTASQPSAFEYALINDKEIDNVWVREGYPTVDVIMGAADIPEDAAKHIQEILSESHCHFDKSKIGEEWEFSEEAYYAEIMPSDEGWQEDWKFFEKILKTESRFFSETVESQLNRVFDRIDEMRTEQGQSLVVDAGPDTELNHLYRARVFQSDEKIKTALKRPDIVLSAPPTNFASAGRMNASGISVFYGATETEIALAEVRPPVGSQVAVARFDIIRPIRLLDLTALSQVDEENGSIFDTGYASRLSRMMFLRSLSTRISRPIMPDDQDSDYLPTQAIADFLASKNDVSLDGILFPSVQQMNRNGLNAVLFHKASKCKEIQIPVGTKIDVDTYPYEEPSTQTFWVTETVPLPDPKPENQQLFQLSNSGFVDLTDWSNYDYREATLQIALESVKVHVINSVSFETSGHSVVRTRYNNEPPEF